MEFVENIEKKEYEKFVKNHKKSHFLQSYAWGEFAEAAKGMKAHYVGLKDNGKLVATALLLEKKLPMGYSYFYSPRGFVIDFSNKELLKEFTQSVKEYAKKHKVIFIKIDPDIIYRKEDNNGEEVKLDYDPKEIFNNITSLGFKHKGFTKNFETMQPRYSFRIDMNQDMDTIVKKFSKTTMQRIKKGESIGTKVRLGTIDDIPTFSHLMDLTENRKDFVSHDLSYYETLFRIYNKDNKMDLFLGSINTKEIVDNYKTELKDVESKINEFGDDESLSTSKKNMKNELVKRRDKLNEFIEEYSKARDEYGDEIVLNAHVIMEYADKAWVLYAGNHNILMNSYSNYKTYYEHIKYCHENGIKIYDQFGTVGDLSPDNPRLGLHEFKKKFGGDYVEFIGEFDLITNKSMYTTFTKLVPFYRNIVKKKAKKNIKKNVEKNPQ